MKHLLSLGTLLLALGCGAGAAQAQYTDGIIKIGVMNDMSGLYSDISGPGAVVAARMAFEDSGAATRGMKVEIVGADHQNKPDVGSNIVHRWIDVDNLQIARQATPFFDKNRGGRDAPWRAASRQAPARRFDSGGPLDGEECS